MARTVCPPKFAFRWQVSIAASLAVLLGAPAVAHAAETPSATAAPGVQPETVTIEARRQLEKRVDHFVSSTVVSYLNESLVRWDSPICPLVAGLPAQAGEFILGRISRSAQAATAPLGGEKCKPNFFVVVSADPDTLLKKWWRRDPQMYDSRNGMGQINSFVGSSLAVRAWYNSEFKAGNGRDLSNGSQAAGAIGTALMTMRVPVNDGPPGGTRLSYPAVQGLASVIVMVDQRKVQDLNFGQLADYIAMVGLAQIRSGSDPPDVPTILSLFGDQTPRPMELTDWDQALLHALYTTSHSSTTQASAIKITMVKQLTGTMPTR